MSKTRTHKEAVLDLCQRLREKGIEFRREYHIRISPEKAMRADIAIFSNNKVACLIEVKRSPSWFRRGLSKQAQKYLATGYPFICCGSSEKSILKVTSDIEAFI
jgi:hypothetical protein